MTVTSIPNMGHVLVNMSERVLPFLMRQGAKEGSQ
jgi:hypothetical protein